MALNDDAVLTAAVGYVYTGPVGTEAPAAADLDDLNLLDTASWGTGLTAWLPTGHTSRGDMPEFGFEGGDSEIKGTWQKKKLAEVTTEDPVDYLTLFLQQFDEGSLTLYYGENASTVAGEFAVASGSKAVERAVLVIIEDGDVRIGFHAFKSSVKRDDAIQLPVDDFASLPVRATFLDYQDKPLFKWLNEDLFPNV
ncbi:major tail protein [Mycobacterium phage Achebe]|uniref:Major tail protein n=1 Tax=Mycobacterium phage Backyardigan TaxID=2902881 RepID=G1BKZ5_9CAUD|nr:major tail protein [Mycobacterium phage Wile]YP_009635435.1 major tail protein [Mycobacterium phage Backyardigan]AOT27531.1 major tail protein [Mycobacterium phage Badger]APD17372.1 major tail protein [Mycobacterium phage Achebe]QAY06931.1 major tail protein [Mycobacterium phage Datway]QCW22672.1 major tail protein [Mycobacterium phage Xena]AEJ94509.1 major tail protein [Mycobacterium phage Backyardigan]